MNQAQLIDQYKENYPHDWREKLAERGILIETECLYQVPKKPTPAAPSNAGSPRGSTPPIHREEHGADR